jgi:hypothetical protein
VPVLAGDVGGGVVLENGSRDRIDAVGRDDVPGKRLSGEAAIASRLDRRRAGQAGAPKLVCKIAARLAKVIAEERVGGPTWVAQKHVCCAVRLVLSDLSVPDLNMLLYRHPRLISNLPDDETINAHCTRIAIPGSATCHRVNSVRQTKRSTIYLCFTFVFA